MKQKEKNIMKYQTMNKQSGFTLIELIIVIVILGILAVTAAPKFISLSGDAKAASLMGVKGSMESAAKLVYAKSYIHGAQKHHTLYFNNPLNPTGVDIHWGYPWITDAGILSAAVISSDDFALIKTINSAVAIQPKGSDVHDPTCNVQYGPYPAEPGTGVRRPSITINTTGC